MTAPEETEDAKKSVKHDKAKPHKKKGAKQHKTVPKAPEAEAPPAVDDRYLRLQADFDNYRKRVLREKDEIYRRANQDIMEELLPVIDHIGLAFGSAGESHQHDPVVEGFRLVADQLMGVLSKFGLSPIETEGQEFDPNLHEAILHMPSPDVAENLIVSQVRCGYRLGERLLRAAQVVVSSGPAGDARADD